MELEASFERQENLLLTNTRNIADNDGLKTREYITIALKTLSRNNKTINMNNIDDDDDMVDDEDGIMKGYQQQEKDQNTNPHSATAATKEENHSDDDDNDTKEYKIKEPKMDLANKQKFFDFCQRLENLQRVRSNKGVQRMPSPSEKLNHLLPKNLIQNYQSLYPILRLLMPDRDSGRKTQTKEASLGNAYIAAMNWGKNSGPAQQIKNFTNPQIVEDGVHGDFSNVLYNLLDKRLDSGTRNGSNLTIGDINKYLNELSKKLATGGGGGGGGSTTKQWGESQSQAYAPQRRGSNNSNNSNKEQKSAIKIREQFVNKLLRHQLSPLEHKWIARILIGDLKIGMGWEKFIRWCYNEHGMVVWKENNSLKVRRKKKSKIQKKNG